MRVELRLKAEDLRPDELFEIYKIFCESYGIEANQHDERNFRRGARVKYVRDSFGLDYRPYMGAKFFGHRRGNGIEFWGYSDPHDPLWENKDEKFKDSLTKWFNERYDGTRKGSTERS